MSKHRSGPFIAESVQAVARVLVATALKRDEVQIHFPDFPLLSHIEVSCTGWWKKSSGKVWGKLSASIVFSDGRIVTLKQRNTSSELQEFIDDLASYIPSTKYQVIIDGEINSC